MISSLIGRVEKLESDLGKAQARIVELAASESRLGASIDAADRAEVEFGSSAGPASRVKIAAGYPNQFSRRLKGLLKRHR